MSRRGAPLAVALALALAIGGCGGDDEASTSAATDTATATDAPAPTDSAPPETTPAETEKAPADAGAGIPDGHSGGQAAPEDSPGGAGDEVPASTQALFTGKDGKITPRLVRVPPFIAIRVELRSGDGEAYELSARGQTLRAAGDPAEPVLFDGLRSGKRLSLAGTGGRVVIEASAEPGP